MSNAYLDAQERADAWPVRYVAGKDIPRSDEYPNHRIVVTAGLHRIGAQRPYFSVTCDIINTWCRGDNAHEGGGAAHEIIAKYFPYLAPVIALHLSDDEGVPMHAADNGAYWLGLTQYKRAQVRPDPNHGLVEAPLPYLPCVASHFRITVNEARQLTTRLRSQTDVEAYVDEQRPRWAAEAESAVNLLRSLG